MKVDNLRPKWQIEALLTPHYIVAERERREMANITAELRRLQGLPITNYDSYVAAKLQAKGATAR